MIRISTRFRAVLCAILCSFAAHAQTINPRVETIAGTWRNLDSTRLQSQFRAAAGLAIHPVTREIYVSDESNFIVRVINGNQVSTLAGSPTRVAGDADGRGDSARFTGPRGLALSRTGDTLFVSDNTGVRNARIRGIITTGPDRGRVFTIAGKNVGNPPPSNNPIGTEARFEGIRELVAGAGYLLVAEDLGPNGRLRRIDLSGTRTVTSLGTGGFQTDIANSNNYPGASGIAFSATPDSVYVTSSTRNKILKISLITGVADTIAGSTRGNADSTAMQAQFNVPRGIAYSQALNRIFISEGGNNSIRVFDLGTRRVTTLAGSSTTGGFIDSVGRAARFNNPIAIELIDSILLVAELANARVRSVALQSGRTRTFAGGGTYLSGNAYLPEFGGGGIVPWSMGRYLLADRRFHALRLLTPGQTVQTFAGTIADAGISPDSSAISAVRFNTPTDLEARNGRLYIADANNRRIMVLDTAGRYARVLAKNIDVTKLVFYNDTMLLAIHQPSGTIRAINPISRTVRTFFANGVAAGDSLIRPGDGDIWNDTLYLTSAGSGSFHIRAISLTATSAGIAKTRYSASDFGLNLSNPGSVIIDRFGTMYIDNAQQRGRVERISLTDNSRPAPAFIFNVPGIAVDGPISTAKAGRNLDLGFDSTEAFLLVLDADNGMVRRAGPLFQVANQAPSFTLTADTLPLTGQILEDSGPITISGLISNVSANVVANETVQNQTVSFTIRVDRPEAFSVLPQMTVSGDSAILSFTPAANMNGWVTLTIIGRDNGGTAFGGVDSSRAKNVALFISPVNDAPSFTATNIVESPNPAMPRQHIAWGSPISSGPSDEAGQVLSFTTTNDSSALFTVQPSITYNNVSGEATLSYTPSGILGTAQVRVVLRDNGGVENGGIDSTIQVFTITFDNTVGVNATSLSVIRLHPNPASEFLVVSASGLTGAKAQITVLDAKGSKVFSKVQVLSSGILSERINTRGLSKGLYFLKVHSGKTERTVKFQVIR